jgi:hypothetical protein
MKTVFLFVPPLPNIQPQADATLNTVSYQLKNYKQSLANRILFTADVLTII